MKKEKKMPTRRGRRRLSADERRQVLFRGRRHLERFYEQESEDAFYEDPDDLYDESQEEPADEPSVDEDYYDESREEPVDESYADETAADEDYADDIREEPSDGAYDETLTEYQEEICSEDYYEEDNDGYYGEDDYEDSPDVYIYHVDNEEEWDDELEIEDIYEEDRKKAPSVMELLAMITTAAIIILAIVVVVMYRKANSIVGEVYDQTVAEAEEALSEAEERALERELAEAEAAAEAARIEAEELERKQKEEEERQRQLEEQINKDTEFTVEEEPVIVKPEIRSVQKDIKVKLTNKDTGKLIASVPFILVLTGGDGSKMTFTDDDMDGIISKNGIAGGSYSYRIEFPEGERYAKYSISRTEGSIEIKDKIEYKKVDVANEVKTEKEVNVAKEDTQVKPAVESEVKDTVEWVEPTQTQSGEEDTEYIVIDRSMIVNPEESAAVRLVSGVRLLTEIDEQMFIIDENGKLVPYNGDQGGTGSDGSTDDDSNRDEPGETIKDSGPTGELQDTPVDTEKDREEDKTEKDSEDDGTDRSNEGDTDRDIIVDDSEEKEKRADEDELADEELTDDEDEEEDRKGKKKREEDEEIDEKEEKEKKEIDWGAALKDRDGNRVFISDGQGGYIKAVAADYLEDHVFYIKKTVTEYDYTGWQTLDGKTYYYDKDGNKVTGEQIIRGVKYKFGDDGALIVDRTSLRGVDVSRWNGAVDWTKVKSAGMDFAVIRCGYRGSSEGAMIEDSSFRTNINGAKNAGLRVGVYFFTQAVNEVEAVEEASMVLSLISGYSLDLPVYLDVEPSRGRGDTISVEQRTAVCRAFCSTIQNAGYTAGIYANKTWMEEKISAASLTSYRIWLAQYATAVTYNATGYDMWQYTSKGSVPGINGFADMNILYR